MSDTVWINTEPTIDGSRYVVTLAASEDRAVTLNRKRTLDYAYALLDAVQRAEYDSAVARQLSKVDGVDEAAAMRIVGELRAARPGLQRRATEPMGFTPGVNSEYRPFLVIEIEGEKVGQWTLPDAREHALALIEAVIAAEQDTTYYKVLRGLVGVDEPVARAMIADLGQWRDRPTSTEEGEDGD